MKKFVRKIILSAFAMTLAVVTLSTTTYAWYVSNTKAKVTGVNGATAQVEGGMLLVAEDKTNIPGNWTASLELASQEGPQLKPVTKVLASDLTGKYSSNGLKEGDWADATGKKVEEVQYIDYKFWILATDGSGEEKQIDVTATVTNTTSSNQPQTVYSVTELPTVGNSAPTKVGDNFTADAVYALAVEIFEETANETNTGLKHDENEPKSLGFGMLLDVLTDGGTYETKEGMVSGGDANKYYKKLLGKAPFGTSEEDGASRKPSESGRIKSLNVVSNIGKRITIRIWLDGASAGCWDSCVGQTFNLALDLKVADPAPVI